MRNNKLPKTALEYVLRALIPYSDANLKLTFKPNVFFNDLEKISNAKERTLRAAYFRAQKEEFFRISSKGAVNFTKKGKRRIIKFTAEHLGKNARLMVIFDIPEDVAFKRQRLRRLLKELDFEQIQKSVWASEYDYQDVILDEIEKNDLGEFLQIYAADRIFPK